MAIQATLHIFALILEKFSSHKSASLNELKVFLEAHDLGKSERSLARYIEQMRHEFGLDIVYDASLKGYVFKRSNDFEVTLFLNFVQLTQTAGIAMEGKKQMDALRHLVQFDNNLRLQGTEHLKTLLVAIQNKRYASFKHTNYHTDKTTNYRFKPILLKQYQYRWYVVGELENGEYRTFGCDRIADLNVEAKTFVAKNTKEVRKKFEQVIGLNYSDGEMKKVRLQLTPLQAKYLKAAPIHASQYVESETEESVIFVLNLIPNYELVQKILQMSSQAKVLSPASLKADVKKHLKETLALYQK
ncbi:MAG: WYL domain-containing protein [Bacteroidota bacterium]|nr:WYL domain-containing protein [Bacteroidota bacterium]